MAVNGGNKWEEKTEHQGTLQASSQGAEQESPSKTFPPGVIAEQCFQVLSQQDRTGWHITTNKGIIEWMLVFVFGPK